MTYETRVLVRKVIEVRVIQTVTRTVRTMPLRKLNVVPEVFLETI